MHVARCVIISPFFLFSPPQSACHSFSLLLNHHPVLPSRPVPSMPTWGRTTPLVFFFPHSLPPNSSLLPPLFLSLPFCLYTSVMAYQDGFYGAADLYVSMRLTPPLSHPSAVSFHAVACGFFPKCETAKTKPIESGYFQSSH